MEEIRDSMVGRDPVGENNERLIQAVTGAQKNTIEALARLNKDKDKELREAERDNQNLIKSSDKLRQQAETDPLTGLARKEAFVKTVMGRPAAEQENAALLLLDIDNFKEINDTY
ncbi:MAG TPA: GGDEF domain-containing protein, partial [Candidatus Limnocylindria bacterium]|nr:GGDEF domain-containing protein [Candidatus Limnocylindria bacterium]